jgi:hypothetical protein
LCVRDGETRFLINADSTDHELPISSSFLLSESSFFIGGILYTLRQIDHRAIAIHIPDASPEIPETIMAHDFTWIVVGIDDPEVGHTRARLHIPDAIEWISPNSFQDSSLECLTFGSAGAFRTLDGFANCFIREITIPPFVELIKEAAFEAATLLPSLILVSAGVSARSPVFPDAEPFANSKFHSVSE